MESFLNSFYLFSIYFVVGVLALSVYTLITPTKEITEIKNGNVNVSISYSGSILGFIIGMAGSIHASLSLIEVISWTPVLLIIFLLTDFIKSKLLKEKNIAVSIFSAVISISIGILFFACISY